MDLTTLHERTVAEFVARVEAVPDDAWGNATPVHRVGRAGARQPRRR